jgi:hypothetical protein
MSLERELAGNLVSWIWRLLDSSTASVPTGERQYVEWLIGEYLATLDENEQAEKRSDTAGNTLLCDGYGRIAATTEGPRLAGCCGYSSPHSAHSYTPNLIDYGQELHDQIERTYTDLLHDDSFPDMPIQALDNTGEIPKWITPRIEEWTEEDLRCLDSIERDWYHAHTKFRLSNGNYLATHGPDMCVTKVCTIHNPSDHHMRTWPLIWRGDKAMFERLCPDKRIGHPDPDDMVYHELMGDLSKSIHGCDGCCSGKNPPTIISLENVA